MTFSVVVAETDCQIAVIEGSVLLAFMDTHHEQGYQLLRHFFYQVTRRMSDNNIRANTIMELYLHEYNTQI